MKKPLRIDAKVINRLAELAPTERSAAWEALLTLCQTFGQPHLHSGLSVRKLGKKLFECRASLALRFLFYDQEGDLFVWFIGTHDEVRALLRSGK